MRAPRSSLFHGFCYVSSEIRILPVSRSRELARKCHAFKILTYKLFVMNILRGFRRVVVAKLLILDIL